MGDTNRPRRYHAVVPGALLWTCFVVAISTLGLQLSLTAPQTEPAQTTSKPPQQKSTPDSKEQRPGLYAMKGSAPAANAGSGYGTGHPQDVWDGLSGSEIGKAYGIGGLGLIGTGRGGGGEGYVGDHTFGQRRNRRKRGEDRHGFVAAAIQPTSTFSIDVDTAAYSRLRASLNRGQLPPRDRIRLEELLNYFDYDDPGPTNGDFVVHSELGPCPWDPELALLRIHLRARTIESAATPPRNLVFLVDTSGSMQAPERLPLLRRALGLLVPQLRPQDNVAIVGYAGQAGLLLPPTPGSQGQRILDALEEQTATGGTHGSAGITLAYEVANEHFVEGGINRVLLATDGDFNLGISSVAQLKKLISEKRESGIYLSVLGFGRSTAADARLEALADMGNGNYAHIDSINEARKVLVTQASETLVPVADDFKLQLHFNAARVARYRLLGYDNRRLAHRDFADDQKDAGELGSGQSVTALYELHLQPDTDARQPLLDIQTRHKPPGGERSQLNETQPELELRAWAQTSDDFRFSAAVAGFARLLHEDASASKFSLADVYRIARASRSSDRHCYRAEFLDLIRRAIRHNRRGRVRSLPPPPECQPMPANRRPKPATSPPPPTPTPQTRSPAATDDLRRSLMLLARALATIPTWLSSAISLFSMGLIMIRRRLRRQAGTSRG